MKIFKKKSHWILIAAHLIRPINTARLWSFNVTARLFSKQPSSVWTDSTYLHDTRNYTNCIKPQKVSLKRLICFQSAVVIVSRRNLEGGEGGTTAYSLVVIRTESSWSQTDATILSQGPAEMEIKKTQNVSAEYLVKFLRFRIAELKLRWTSGVILATSLAVLPQQVLSYQLEVVVFFPAPSARELFILAHSSRMSHAESK